MHRPIYTGITTATIRDWTIQAYFKSWDEETVQKTITYWPDWISIDIASATKQFKYFFIDPVSHLIDH